MSPSCAWKYLGQCGQGIFGLCGDFHGLFLLASAVLSHFVWMLRMLLLAHELMSARWYGLAHQLPTCRILLQVP